MGKRCTFKSRLCICLQSRSAGKIVEKNCFDIFPPFPLHQCFLPLSFESQTQSCSPTNTSPILPSSCPVLVTTATKLQHSKEQSVLTLGTFLPLTEGSFSHSQLILWSPEEDHPWLLLRERKKTSLLTGKTATQQNSLDLNSLVEKLLVFT